ncbi:MAG: ABC transporter ATP-binding protein [Firmicutes bacterium]|jgi:lipoprotein-releasing system ATP-binding protein|nr:ABC transporter ATP-binding protein [Bacillota bacterium]
MDKRPDKRSKGASPIVELRGVSKQYPGEKRLALTEIDLSIYPGEFLTVLGPSGAGKTTLLHMIGLLDRPSSGEVMTMGIAANGLREDERANLRNGFLGFVFQFHFLLPDLTVEENVLLPLLISDERRGGLPTPRAGSGKWESIDPGDPSGHRQPGSCMRLGAHQRRKHPKQEVEKLLAAVGLRDKASSLPAELSGGEKQRAAVARALAGAPPLILADEPTGNLDTANANLVWDLLAKANVGLGTAIVAITHNEELARKAQRVLHIVDGRIVDNW